MVAHVGGKGNNGSNDGVRNWNVNNSSANTNLNIVSQTLISKLFSFYCICTSFPLGKNSADKEHVLVGLSRKIMRLIRR